MQRRPEKAPAARPRMAPQLLDYDELAAWLRVTTTPKLGGAGLRRLLNAFGLPDQVMRESEASLAQCVGETLAQSLCAPPSAYQEWLADYTSIWLEEPGHYVLTLADPAYPASLLASPDPPAMLYVCGRVELLHPGPSAEPAIAIVGSRQASSVGRANAGLFARELGAAGVTVVSGLANGIDAAAHWGAVGTVGGTVAIVGTGADRVYPENNLPLAREIAGLGAVVSELPLATPPRAAHFPRRNRLIAALGVGVLVVEAAPYSGSLITARLAADCGRDVYAIPGSIQSLCARGCNRLIREGAMLVETPLDILVSLGLAKLAPEPEKRKGGPRERAAKRSTKADVHEEPNPGFDAGDGRAGALTVKASNAGLDQGAGTAGTTGPDADEEIVGGTTRSRAAPASPDLPEEVLMRELGHDPASIDVLAARTGLPGETVQAAVLALELDGRIEWLPGGRIVPVTA